MKIILLRHEERFFDVGFFSNLTVEGLIRFKKYYSIKI